MGPENFDLSQWRRWHTDLVILSLLRHQPLHGYGLYRILQEAGGQEFQITRATLYPLLQRFEREKWIKNRWEEGPKHRLQKVYILTPTGNTTLEQRLDQWKRSIKTFERLLAYSPQKIAGGRPLKPEELSRVPRYPRAKKIRKKEDTLDTIVKAGARGHFPLRKVLGA